MRVQSTGDGHCEHNGPAHPLVDSKQHAPRNRYSHPHGVDANELDATKTQQIFILVVLKTTKTPHFTHARKKGGRGNENTSCILLRVVGEQETIVSEPVVIWLLRVVSKENLLSCWPVRLRHLPKKADKKGRV